MSEVPLYGMPKSVLMASRRYLFVTADKREGNDKNNDHFKNTLCEIEVVVASKVVDTTWA